MRCGCAEARPVDLHSALTLLIGAYMYRVHTGERVLLTRVLGPVERMT